MERCSQKGIEDLTKISERYQRFVSRDISPLFLNMSKQPTTWFRVQAPKPSRYGFAVALVFKFQGVFYFFKRRADLQHSYWRPLVMLFTYRKIFLIVNSIKLAVRQTFPLGGDILGLDPPGEGGTVGDPHRRAGSWGRGGGDTR